MFYTLARSGTSSNLPTGGSGSVQNLPTSTPGGTPKIIVILKNSNTIKVRYFRKLEFLDNQAEFAGVFGDNPTIIPLNPVMLQDNTTTSRSLYSFGKRCKLNIFMDMFRRYYVGHNLVDNALNFQDVCRQIL